MSIDRRTKVQAYAEDKLGVLTTYQEAKEFEAELEVLYPERARLERDLSQAKYDLHVLETDIANKVQSTLPENTTATATERIIKNEIANDKRVRTFQLEIIRLSDNLTDKNSEIKILELKLRTASARMHEVAGYLGYMAAFKNAASVARQLSDTPL